MLAVHTRRLRPTLADGLSLSTQSEQGQDWALRLGWALGCAPDLPTLCPLERDRSWAAPQ